MQTTVWCEMFCWAVQVQATPERLPSISQLCVSLICTLLRETDPPPPPHGERCSLGSRPPCMPRPSLQHFWYMRDPSWLLAALRNVSTGLPSCPAQTASKVKAHGLWKKRWLTLLSSTVLFIVLYNLALLGLAFNSLFLGGEKGNARAFFFLLWTRRSPPRTAVKPNHIHHTQSGTCVFQPSSNPKRISPHPSLTSAGRFGSYNPKQ